MSDERQQGFEEESKVGTHGANDEGDDVEAHSKGNPTYSKGNPTDKVVGENDEGDDVVAHSKSNPT